MVWPNFNSHKFVSWPQIYQGWNSVPCSTMDKTLMASATSDYPNLSKYYIYLSVETLNNGYQTCYLLRIYELTRWRSVKALSCSMPRGILKGFQLFPILFIPLPAPTIILWKISCASWKSDTTALGQVGEFSLARIRNYHLYNWSREISIFPIRSKASRNRPEATETFHIFGW